MTKMIEKWLDSLPIPEGDLKEFQSKGREYLQSTGLPSNREESWRLTKLNKLEDIFKLPLSNLENKNSKNIIHTSSPSNGIRIILNNSINDLDSIALPQGLRLLSKQELKDQLNNYEKQSNMNENWTIALNKACTDSILGLKVEGNEVPPIEIVIPSDSSKIKATRLLFVLEEKASLQLLQVFLGEKDSAQNHLIQIDIGKEAKVEHGLIAMGKNEASLMTNLIINQKAKSSYALTSIQEGYIFSRLETHIIQVEGKANTILKGLQFSKDSEQIDTHSSVTFNGPEGCLDQVQKAAAKDQSHSIFNGAIKVPKVAQQTNASQLSRNILLSKKARIDTKPQLEIIADDVKCAHGATISQLEEDELFYLRSRGISASKAATLLIQGYCIDIIEKLPVEANRWKVLDKLLSYLK